MNEFDARYYPLKRAFPARSENFHKTREIRVQKNCFKGKYLTVKKLLLPVNSPTNRGKRLVFISDWHWHNSTRNRKILQEFREIVAEISPDVLLLGGDMCDDAVHLDVLSELLSGLSGSAPEILAVKGNWESGKCWLAEDFFKNLYAEYGIKLLENTTVRYGNLRFTGMADLSSLYFRYISAPPADDQLTDILMVHSPDAVIASDSHGFLDNFSYAFCGHNHGGQIRLPIIGALYCPSFYRCRFDRGIFAKKNSKLKMIVSSGIGEHSGSIRFLCPPELIIAEFC